MFQINDALSFGSFQTFSSGYNTDNIPASALLSETGDVLIAETGEILIEEWKNLVSLRALAIYKTGF